MITVEQRQIIVNNLKGKHLPLDLFVEIEDHISEQIEHKIFFENQSFEIACKEVFEAWNSNELKLKQSFFESQKKTAIHRKISRETDKNLNLKALKFMMIIMLFSMFLLFLAKDLAKYFILIINALILPVGLLVTIFDYKTLKTSFNLYDKRISYLQKNVSFITTALIVGPYLILSGFDRKFLNFYNSFLESVSGNISFEFVGWFFVNHIYVYLCLLGVLYYLEYKKAIKILERKINFKL